MPTTHIRRFQIETRKANADERTAPVVLSTEYPVNRGGYTEILAHTPDAVDLTRSPLPLVEAHDTGKVNIGIIENLRVVGRKLRGTLRMGSSARALELWRDIEDRIVRSLSVGYQWIGHRVEGDGVVRVTRWQPYEASLVAAPADPNAGLFRNRPRGNPMIDEFEDIADSGDVINPSRNQRRKTNNALRDTDQAVREERDRIANIHALTRKFGHQDLADRAISDGWSLNQYRQALMDLTPPASTSLRPGASDAHGPLPPGGARSIPGYERDNVLGLSAGELQRYSLLRAIRALADPRHGRDAGFELEVSDAMQKATGRSAKGLLVPTAALTIQQRALTKAGAGGALVADEYLPEEFVDVLRARSFVMRMGTPLNGLHGDVTIPTKTSSGTAYWIAADGTDSLNDSEFTPGGITLTPRTVGGLTTFSHKLMLQSSPDIETLVRQDLADTVAAEVDLKGLAGDGTGETPVGVLNATGIGSVAFATPGAPTLDEIVQLEEQLALFNADQGSLAYLMGPTMMRKLKTTDVGTDTGKFIWQSSPTPGEGRVNNFPAFYTTNCPAGKVVFGQWADVLIGLWGVLEIDVDPYSGPDGTNFKKGSVSVRVLMDVDIGLRRTQSIALGE